MEGRTKTNEKDNGQRWVVNVRCSRWRCSPYLGADTFVGSASIYYKSPNKNCRIFVRRLHAPWVKSVSFVTDSWNAFKKLSLLKTLANKQIVEVYNTLSFFYLL